MRVLDHFYGIPSAENARWAALNLYKKIVHRFSKVYAWGASSKLDKLNQSQHMVSRIPTLAVQFESEAMMTICVKNSGIGASGSGPQESGPQESGPNDCVQLLQAAMKQSGHGRWAASRPLADFRQRTAVPILQQDRFTLSLGQRFERLGQTSASSLRWSFWLGVLSSAARNRSKHKDD